MGCLPSKTTGDNLAQHQARKSPPGHTVQSSPLPTRPDIHPAEPQAWHPADVVPSRDAELDVVGDTLWSDSFSASHRYQGLVSNTLPVQPLTWTRGELLGVGAFGRVYLAENNETGELLAVKQVVFEAQSSLATREVLPHIKALETEIGILCQLKHPNIVQYYGTERTADTLNIFLEYVPCGSIASVLKRAGPFDEPLIKCYTRQILKGLEYLHLCGYMHRDIKGANVLIDSAGIVKLADFGASKKIETVATLTSGAKSVKGTPYWMAPEVIKQTGHGRPADIWSVGCTVIEMATGKHAWGDLGNAMVAMFKIASSDKPPPIPAHLSPEAKDFLQLCFTRTPQSRPNATRLLKHPFITGLHGATLPPPSSPHDMPVVRPLSTPTGTTLPAAHVRVFEYPTSGHGNRDSPVSQTPSGQDGGSSPHSDAAGTHLPALVLPPRARRLDKMPGGMQQLQIPVRGPAAPPQGRPSATEVDAPQSTPVESQLLEDAVIMRVGSNYGQQYQGPAQSKTPGAADATKQRQWERELTEEIERERQARHLERSKLGQRS